MTQGPGVEVANLTMAKAALMNINEVVPTFVVYFLGASSHVTQLLFITQALESIRLLFDQSSRTIARASRYVINIHEPGLRRSSAVDSHPGLSATSPQWSLPVPAHMH